MVNDARLHGRDAIGVRVGKVVCQYPVAKHFALDIGDHHFHFELDEQRGAPSTRMTGSADGGH